MCDAVMRTLIANTPDVSKLVGWLYDVAPVNMPCRNAYAAMPIVRVMARMIGDVRSKERGSGTARASARGNGGAQHSFSAAGSDSSGRQCATPRCVLA